MTFVNVFMCVAMGCMLVGVAVLGIIVGKLSYILSELQFMYRKVDHTSDNVEVIRWHLDDVKEEICGDEEEDEECCCGDTESHKDGYTADDEDELDIHLITPEDYHFANGYSKNELTYFPNTDQVKYFFDDDTCLSMEDIPEYIGDGLLFFGMNIQEPNVVYVRNHVLNADFRIEKFEVHCDA